MVTGVVRGRVAGPQHRRQRLTGRVREAEHRVEPEPVLVVGGGSFLLLRVDLDERRVDVQHDWAPANADPGAFPHPAADLGDRVADFGQDRLVELVHGAPHRRVRRHLAEQPRLGAEMLDIRAALAAPGEHQHHLGEHRPAVMQRHPVALPWDHRRQRRAQPKAISELPQRMQPDMGDDLLAAVFYHHTPCAVTVHLSGAFLSVVLAVSQLQEKPKNRHLSRPGYLMPSQTRELSRLGESIHEGAVRR